MARYSDQVTVLLVEDSRTTRLEMKKILQESAICDQVVEAENGIDAIQKLHKSRFDLIICDVMMPQMDGFRFLMILNEKSELKEIPVILVSATKDVSQKVRGLDIGAWDYICKPFEPVELIARSRVMLRIKKLQDNLKVRMLELKQLSIIDSLTGLYNKQHLFDYLKKKFKEELPEDEIIGCIMVDLDNFKEINDTYGHLQADAVLKEVGAILDSVLRGGDIAARYGGDEFVIILKINEVGFLPMIAERLRGLLADHDYSSCGESFQTVRITASMGSAYYPSKGITTVDGLIRAADEGLYHAKASGKNCSITPKIGNIN